MTQRGSVKTICRECGSGISRPPSLGPGEFCSRACQKAARRTKADCRTCGKAFTFKNSQKNHYANAGTYCSPRCRTRVPIACLICGAASYGPSGTRFCPQHRGQSYKLLSPVARKAWSMSSPLMGFKDKRLVVQAMLEAVIGEPCPYCGVGLTLANVGMDHKEPINSSHRDRSKVPLDVRVRLDNPSNLQIICRSCNGAKGNFSDPEYRLLLAFVSEHPTLGAKLMARIRAACILHLIRRAA